MFMLQLCITVKKVYSKIKAGNYFIHLNAGIRGEISKLYKCFHTKKKLFKMMFVYVYSLSIDYIYMCIYVCVCVCSLYNSKKNGSFSIIFAILMERV